MMEPEGIVEPPSNAGFVGCPTPLTGTSRGRVLIEFAVFGAVFVWAELAQLDLPVSWGEAQLSIGKIQASPPVLALLAVLFLWIHGGIREVNFAWRVQWKRALWQLLLVLAAFLVVSAISSWINHLLFGRSPQADDIKSTLIDPRVQSFVLLSLPVWAFAEELCYRAYLIQRLERLTSAWRHSTLLAVLLSSAVFALCHLQYGPSKLPVYVISGLLFSGIYLCTRRNIWFVTLVHWLSNTFVLTLG